MDVLDAIKNRRSITFFDQTKSIPEHVLLELLKISNLAPSSSNLQPWEVIIVTTQDKKRILRQCAFNQAKVEEASAVLILIANPYSVEENIDKVIQTMVSLGYITEEKKESYKSGTIKFQGPRDSERRKIFAVKNTSLFAMNLMIAARAFGLETHPMDGFDEECIKKEFNIPDYKLIPMLIAIGYKRNDVQLLPRGYRRDINEFVKFE